MIVKTVNIRWNDTTQNYETVCPFCNRLVLSEFNETQCGHFAGEVRDEETGWYMMFEKEETIFKKEETVFEKAQAKYLEIIQQHTSGCPDCQSDYSCMEFQNLANKRYEELVEQFPEMLDELTNQLCCEMGWPELQGGDTGVYYLVGSDDVEEDILDDLLWEGN